ncbi:MAG: SpoIIE family protein phosphatase, partial [Leptospiraceae bacterium]|nr:SpoIIE family protein phosphatase [Leptospiraceae bacterium]
CIVLASSFYLWHETVITENKLFYERLKTKEALENVEALKFQQDGDFFLISLLTDPLSYQTSESSFIKISSVLKSKKEFWFKNKKKEIGGDLNIIDEIFFGDRRFLFFLNADAMGKSIQGASGALILGAAIKSILLRTKHAQTKQESYPEIWIRNIYVEIQQLFETFGCSMLVSGILGLVEEETGLVYYINAEHPFLILYRDHKASFVDRDFSTRKWGTPGNNEVIQVRIFQMKQNDYLICGSDGKDDILIKQKNNEKILNYDEEYIFKIIESTNGDSSEIFEKILEVAELTDDFSLISIQYLGKTRQYKYSYKEDFIEFQKEIFKEKKNRNYKQAKEICLQMLKEYPFDLNLLKQVVLLSLRIENYEEAINFAKKVLETHPLETRFLFYISYANYKLGDMARAIFYAERAYLREPLNVRYISHLAQLYKLNHEYPKAVIHAKRGLELEPTNTILQKISRLYDI